MPRCAPAARQQPTVSMDFDSSGVVGLMDAGRPGLTPPRPLATLASSHRVVAIRRILRSLRVYREQTPRSPTGRTPEHLERRTHSPLALRALPRADGPLCRARGSARHGSPAMDDAAPAVPDPPGGFTWPDPPGTSERSDPPGRSTGPDPLGRAERPDPRPGSKRERPLGGSRCPSPEFGGACGERTGRPRQRPCLHGPGRRWTRVPALDGDGRRGRPLRGAAVAP